MTRIIRPDDFAAQLRELLNRVRALESAAPLGYSTISEGALRVLSAEGLIVEGSARVSGILLVTGEEVVDGTLRINGTLIVAGGTEITGPTTITGTFGIDGDTTITGDVTLTGNFTVTGDGRIQIGDMTLNPTDGGGSVVFANGTKVWAYAGGVGMEDPGNAVVYLADGAAQMSTGGAIVRVEGDEASVTADTITTVGRVFPVGLRTVAESDPAAGGRQVNDVFWEGDLVRVVAG